MFGKTITTKKLFCQCLHDIESGSGRSQFCFAPCADQREIMRLKGEASLVADPVKLQAHIEELEQRLSELRNNPPSSHSALLLHAMEKQLAEEIIRLKSHLPKTES